MKNSTRENIYNYIELNQPISVNDIVNNFSLGKAIIHRHLLKLILENKIYKKGTPPKVFYFSNEENKI